MSVLPQKKVERIEFSEDHNAAFAANAVAIGTTTAAVTDLQTKTTAARAAFENQRTAYNAAQSATNTYNLAVAAMTTALADILKSIKTKAATAGDSVYSLADIPVPASPSPKAPPGTPSDFKVALNGDGSVDLKWKCANPAGTSGTIYQVWRQLEMTGAFVYVGGTGERKITDMTLPAGTTKVNYKIQGVRSTTAGPWATFNVYFGVSSSGTATASLTTIAA